MKRCLTLNQALKQCVTAREVEDLILDVNALDFTDENCATAFRHLSIRNSSNSNAITKVTSILTNLNQPKPNCLSESCVEIVRGRLFCKLPFSRHIEQAKWTQTSPFHLSRLIWSFHQLNQVWPSSVSVAVLNTRTFTPPEFPVLLHSFADSDVENRLEVGHKLAQQLPKPCIFTPKQLGVLDFALNRLNLSNEDVRLEFAKRGIPFAYNDTSLYVSSFYKFFPVSVPRDLRIRLYKLCADLDIKGTIFVAKEGVNATICGSRKDLDSFYSHFPVVEVKESSTTFWPFRKLICKEKSELVVMGEEVDVSKAGKFIQPQDWDGFISNPDVIVVDTRNLYETKLGRFCNALLPDIDRFRDFPQWLKQHQHQFEGKKLAMYCTGGIRCEKTTALAKTVLNTEEVYHLQGGILAYLNQPRSTLWTGDCFVFDDRVAIDDESRPSQDVPIDYKLTITVK